MEGWLTYLCNRLQFKHLFIKAHLFSNCSSINNDQILPTIFFQNSAGKSLLNDYKTSSKPSTFKDKEHALVIVLSFPLLSAFIYKITIMISSYIFSFFHLVHEVGFFWDIELQANKKKLTVKNSKIEEILYFILFSLPPTIINYINCFLETDERWRLYCHLDS